MSKGERTRERIIRQTGPLFNERGYAGAALSDILEATGLRKGGIYNHFASKDELALAAFDHTFELASRHVVRALEGKEVPVERLSALLEAYRTLLEEPALRGGCPILNTAVESDDTHPALRERARAAMDRWRALFRNTIERGIACGTVRAVDADEVASVMISTIEGAVMMSKLYSDRVHLERAINHLQRYVEEDLAC